MKIIKESGTDRAKEALSKYIDDIDYLNDGIEMIVKNTEWLYDQYRNKRIKTHGVVWSGLLELIRSDLHEPLTSSQLQAGFKALGIDYKEFLEPIVKNMEEIRNEELTESTLIEVPKDAIESDLVENINDNSRFNYSYSSDEIYEKLLEETGWSYEDSGFDSEEEYEEYLKEEVDSIDKIISEDELVIIEPEMGVDYPGFKTGKVKMILKDGREFIGDADEEDGLPLISVVEGTMVYPVDELDKDDPLLESKAEEEGLEEIVNKLDKIGATPDNILDSDIKSKYDSVLSKLGVELNKGEVPFIYKVTKSGKQIGRINFNKVAKKWEFRVSTFKIEGKDTTVSEYLKELSDISDFEIVQAFKKAIKYGLVSNKVIDYIINDCILNKGLKRESKSTVNYGTIADKINELEVELDVFSNDSDVDQKEIKSIKDKIYRLSKKLTECIHKLPTEINEDKDKNIENIKSALKASGIKNERTLDLMSKDVLKTLQSNYNKDCKDQEGNYYNPAITSAIQGVIQRITGSRPKASFGEGRTKKLLFANKNINESLSGEEALENRYIKIEDEGITKYAEVSIMDNPQRPEEYDEGYIDGWNKGEDPEYGKEQERIYQMALEAYEEGDVYSVRSVDDIIIAILYGYDELEEFLIDSKAEKVNVDEKWNRR